MSRKGSQEAGFWCKWGIAAIVVFAFAFVWLAIYTLAVANGVSTGGIGPGSAGEMVLLLAGLPVVLLGLSRRFGVFAAGIGLVGFAGLFIDSIIFQNPLVSTNLLSGLSNFAASSQSGFVYQSSKQSIVVTFMAFSTAEESGMSLIRTLMDFAFGITPGTSNYVLKGLLVSFATTCPMFDAIHLFVTVPAYAQLLNAPPVFGFFNIAIFLSPFGLSAYFARAILDTVNRFSKDHISGIVAHAGFDGFITALTLGLL